MKFIHWIVRISTMEGKLSILGLYFCLLCINCLTLEPEPEPEAKLIFALENNINVYSLTPGKSASIFEDRGYPVGITIDSSNEFIYWTDVETPTEAIYRSKLDGTNVEPIVTQGLITPEGIAFDWIAGNIYFTDNDLAHIAACDKEGFVCSILIQESLDKPRGIVIHPFLKILFWTDWGEKPTVNRAGMDGSHPRSIVTEGLNWPNGITVDLDELRARIYWIDEDRIESTDLNGYDRKIIRSSGIGIPFGIDVWKDKLYFSDWTKNQIQSCNKLTGQDNQIIYSSPKSRINGLTIYHPERQQQDTEINPCLNHLNMNPCSHLCLLSHVQPFQCKCPVGMILQNDQKTCIDDPTKPKLFVAEGKSVKQMFFNSIGKNILAGPILEQLHTIGSIAYNPVNKTFIIFEPFRRIMFTYNPQTDKLTTLISRHLNAVQGISIDTVGQNLYWTDAGKQTVEVMSFQTGAKAILYIDDENRPFDIIVALEVESLFVSIVGRRQGKILRMSMDGQEIHRLVEISNGEPVAIAYAPELKYLFWADPIKDTIEHIRIDGKYRSVTVSQLSSPFSLVAHANRIYWTERTSFQLNSIQLGPEFQDSSIYIGPLLDDKSQMPNPEGDFFAFLGVVDNNQSHLETLMNTHECSVASGKKPKCSHICLMSADTGLGTCMCPEGLKLHRPANADDNKLNRFECIPIETCVQGELTCDDGTCIPIESKCDNFRDCLNGEDELNCTFVSLVDCLVSDFKCKSDHTCISGDWKCDGEADCSDGSDEMNCIFGPELLTLPLHSSSNDSNSLISSTTKETCPPSQFWCLSGECVPYDRVCDQIGDCADASDEGGQCEDSCESAHGCFYRCHKTPSGPLCTCPFGYSTSEDLKNCQDIDECLDNICDHYCQNVNGSFKCTCHHDFTLSLTDNRTCTPKEHPPLFIYRKESQIFVLDENFVIQNEIDGTPSLTAIDIDSHNKYIYWVDSQAGVWRIGIDRDSSPEQLISNLIKPTLIAYDWISNNAIIVDKITSRRSSSFKKRMFVIKICSLNNNPNKRGCKTLHNVTGHEITSIKLDLEHGWVFWTIVHLTEFGTTHGVVHRANLDSFGNIVTIASDKVISPTGLSLDHVFQRIFWIDTITRTIEMANFDGTNRVTIISSQVSMKANSLNYFNKLLLWIDEDGINGCSINQVQPNCVRLKNETDLHNLVMLQMTLQPTGNDPCRQNKCDFICAGRSKNSSLNSNSSSLESVSNYICFCPDGFDGFESLDSNNFNCSRSEVRQKLENPDTEMTPNDLTTEPSDQIDNLNQCDDDPNSNSLNADCSTASFDTVVIIGVSSISLMFLVFIIYGLINCILKYQKQDISCVQPGSSSLELVPLKVI